MASPSRFFHLVILILNLWYFLHVDSYMTSYSFSEFFLSVFCVLSSSRCGRHLAHTVFSDDATLPVSTSEFVSPFTGTFQPIEPLSTYAGLRASGEWVLGVYDHDVDGLKGKVEDVSLRFTTQECDQTFHWTPLLGHHQNNTASSTSTSSGSASANDDNVWPSPRAQHAAVVVDQSMFVYGGRGFGNSVSSSSSSQPYAAMSTRVLHEDQGFGNSCMPSCFI